MRVGKTLGMLALGGIMSFAHATEATAQKAAVKTGKHVRTSVAMDAFNSRSQTAGPTRTPLETLAAKALKPKAAIAEDTYDASEKFVKKPVKKAPQSARAKAVLAAIAEEDTYVPSEKVVSKKPVKDPRAAARAALAEAIKEPSTETTNTVMVHERIWEAHPDQVKTPKPTQKTQVASKPKTKTEMTPAQLQMYLQAQQNNAMMQQWQMNNMVSQQAMDRQFQLNNIRMQQENAAVQQNIRNNVNNANHTDPAKYGNGL